MSVASVVDAETATIMAFDAFLEWQPNLEHNSESAVRLFAKSSPQFAPYVDVLYSLTYFDLKRLRQLVTLQVAATNVERWVASHAFVSNGQARMLLIDHDRDELLDAHVPEHMMSNKTAAEEMLMRAIDASACKCIRLLLKRGLDISETYVRLEMTLTNDYGHTTNLVHMQPASTTKHGDVTQLIQRIRMVFGMEQRCVATATPHWSVLYACMDRTKNPAVIEAILTSTKVPPWHVEKAWERIADQDYHPLRDVIAAARSS